MKKAIIKHRTITTALIAICMLGITQVTLSADITKPSEGNKGPLEFMFVEKTTKGPLFQLKVNNAQAGEFLVEVKDNEGYLLYSEILKGINLSRKYQINMDGEQFYESFYIRFEITSLKTHETFTYNASNKNSVVSNIVIAKL